MLGKLANVLLKPFNLQLCSLSKKRDLDLEDELFLEIYKEVKEFTMTSKTDLYALYTALEFLITNKIEGDLIECGVWKGGSSMFIAHYLVKKNLLNRKIYLYDTFSGMTTPSAVDIDLNGIHANQKRSFSWNPVSIQEVRDNMLTTEFPKENIILIEGDVKEVLPKAQHDKISLLRLDTDWYESTLIELKYLYPKLTLNGILILDDHGHWLGARKAAEEYFNQINEPILLSKINYSTRVAIKLSLTNE